jgi:flagellar basal-body rod protein FlgG
MLEGLYAAASGMEAQQRQFDAISNDLANVDTPGYQGELVGFHDLLYTTAGSASGTTLATGAGAAASIVGRSRLQGALHQTGRPLDVAIQGDGYLEVRRPDGTIGLTRNGGLEIDGQGRLTNQEGMLVQPPITIPSGIAPSTVTIDRGGNLTAAGRPLGRLQLVTVPNPNGLNPDGNSLFTATAASGPIRAATGAILQQGALETSNVDMGQTMASMISAQKNYSLSSQAVQYQDQMLQIANDIKP